MKGRPVGPPFFYPSVILLGFSGGWPILRLGGSYRISISSYYFADLIRAYIADITRVWGLNANKDAISCFPTIHQFAPALTSSSLTSWWPNCVGIIKAVFPSLVLALASAPWDKSLWASGTSPCLIASSKSSFTPARAKLARSASSKQETMPNLPTSTRLALNTIALFPSTLRQDYAATLATTIQE